MSIPSPTIVTSTDDRPLDTRGSGTPVIGNTPITAPMFTAAWPTIQTVIAFYALVMAGLMLTGGKLGDLMGRRRAFKIGICIYAVGSGLTAASWSVPSLMLGWSVLEGIGAMLTPPPGLAENRRAQADRSRSSPRRDKPRFRVA